MTLGKASAGLSVYVNSRTLGNLEPFGTVSFSAPGTVLTPRNGTLDGKTVKCSTVSSAGPYLGWLEVSWACASLPWGAVTAQLGVCQLSPITAFSVHSDLMATLHTWVRSALGRPPEQDSRFCMAGTAAMGGPVSVSLSPQGLGPGGDCPVSLQMRPLCRRMFRATCLLRGPFLTDRTLCSGLRVAIRPMGTSRAMVKPQSLMQLPMALP